MVNITDVDDKLIVQAQKDGTTVKDLAERVTADYLDCLEALGRRRHRPHAPRHRAHRRDHRDHPGLIDKGFAYESGGDVYFDVTRAPEYGKLSHRDPEELQAGARIEPSALKRHPGDFALWKSSKPGEPSWESPWGPGRPGWHIECSAMSMKLLGQHFDIHGGGLDLVFPHHENEVVQSESYTGEPFATYWLHNGLLTKEGKKISKSDPGTIVLMSDLLESARPRHAPRPLPVEPLPPADRLRPDPARRDRRGLQTFYQARSSGSRSSPASRSTSSTPPVRRAEFDPGDSPRSCKEIAEHRQRFLDAMDDDFNTGGAIGELFDIVHALNRYANAGLTAGLVRPGSSPSTAPAWSCSRN